MTIEKKNVASFPNYSLSLCPLINVWNDRVSAIRRFPMQQCHSLLLIGSGNNVTSLLASSFQRSGDRTGLAAVSYLCSLSSDVYPGKQRVSAGQIKRHFGSSEPIWGAFPDINLELSGENPP